MATLTCPVPTNLNPLSPNGFRFNITKLPDVEFFCQEVNLPEMSLGATQQYTPLSDPWIPGDKLDFGELTLQFLVDAEMKNYKAIHHWLVGLGFPKTWQQYTNFIKEDEKNQVSELMQNYSDGVLQILNNTNNPAQSIQFRDIFPTGLQSITFLSTSQDVQYIVGNATFRYSYYEFID